MRSIVALAHHVGESVGAEQDAIAGHDFDGVHVDVDVRVDAERTRDDRPLRVRLGLFAREPALADELLDQAVVVGELAEVAVVHEVRTGVADVADEEALPPATTTAVSVVPMPVSSGRRPPVRARPRWRG